MSGNSPSQVPSRLAALFWDCDLRTLDLERHRDQVIERVLQDGDLESVRWLLATYGDETLQRFIVSRGRERLQPKILSFWGAYYGLEKPECTTTSSLVAKERRWRY